jgi:hypothetical protein
MISGHAQAAPPASSLSAGVGYSNEDACYAAELDEISRGRRLTDVTTDGTADTQKVDVASHDEQWVHWHVYDDTLVA